MNNMKQKRNFNHKCNNYQLSKGKSLYFSTCLDDKGMMLYDKNKETRSVGSTENKISWKYRKHQKQT